MKIAIIGAGFTGLSAGYQLTKNGHDVTIFESEDKPGGLALGFEQDRWDWSLEAHYHHWFTNDDSILDLAKEIGHEVKIVRPKTSTYIDNQIYQLDSPVSLLKFDKLSMVNRLRTGIVLAYLKLTPYWKPLERITAKNFLVKHMGEQSWKILWEPLFVKKFGKYANEISAVWFWARIKKRTPSLAYPKGGFQRFADHVAKTVEKQGAKINYNTQVLNIKKAQGKIRLQFSHPEFISGSGAGQRDPSTSLRMAKRQIPKQVRNDKRGEEFDFVICTLPSFLFTKITSGLPQDYQKKLLNLKGLGAVNLVLSLKEQFLKDGTYWVNVNEMNFPFLAVVEHTNFMDKKYYNNEHVLYVGNYLDMSHEYFHMQADELAKIFLPYLKKINPEFKKSQINEAYVFKASFAQPVVPLNYSEQVPKMKTPIKNLYLANMQQVYPWDRGTNYAVQLGEEVAELVIRNQ